MAGIPSHLRNSLRKILAASEPFGGNSDLQNLFDDPRLTPWRYSIPEADGRNQRADSVISYLLNKKHRDGSNALISLLLVLAEGMDEEDARREELTSLANQLGQLVSKPVNAGRSAGTIPAPPLPVEAGRSNPPAPPPEKRDFFISYNQHDKDWAEWIAWQLENAGYTIFIQAWDFRPGGNFVTDMQKASAESKRTIAVLSPTYLTSEFAQSEWNAAFARDPAGKKGILLPVRVRECDLQGLLPQVVYIDLIDVSVQQATERLLAGIKQGRAKPLVPPNFPGTTKQAEPPFPGNS